MKEDTSWMGTHTVEILTASAGLLILLSAIMVLSNEKLWGLAFSGDAVGMALAIGAITEFRFRELQLRLTRIESKLEEHHPTPNTH